jgi:hypothetical protein
VNETISALGTTFARTLDQFRYRKSDGALIRKLPGGWQAVFLDLLPSPGGKLKLCAHAQVRVDAIEEAYIRYNPFLSAADARKHPTLSINCDELILDKSLAHAFAAESQGLNEFAERYLVELRGRIIPWLEKYSSEREIFESLANDDPLQWVTSDRLQRYPVLLAILALREDWDHFERVAAEFLEYCEAPHATAYRSLAQATIEGVRATLIAPKP